MKKVVFAAVCAIVLVIVAAIIISCRPNEGTIEQRSNRTIEQRTNRWVEELEAKIDKATAEVQKRKTGHVIVGRVFLDGRGNVRDVRAQMEILSEGYFAGPTKNLDRPVGFRMHQYAPYDLQLKDMVQDEKRDWVNVDASVKSCFKPQHKIVETL